MGSFQQVVMGGICLVAVFWFGSFINEQPVTLQQPLHSIDGASFGTGSSSLQVASQQAEKPQNGLLWSFFDTSKKPRPVTLEDLKSRSMPAIGNAVAVNSAAPSLGAQAQRLADQGIATATEVVSDFVSPPAPEFEGGPSFTTKNITFKNSSTPFASRTQAKEQTLAIGPTQPRDQQRLEIVPDFSTLADDFRRDQAEQFQRIGQQGATPNASNQVNSMLPIPKLDDLSQASLSNVIQQPDRDWNAVRQGVMSVEEKLKQFHQAHPVAEDFEPLRALDTKFPVAVTTTAGRFIPDAPAAIQQRDRLEADRLEASLLEYERQELARQELQRQEFLKHRPQTLAPEPAWNNSGRRTERPIPGNQLRAESQFSGRAPTSERRLKSPHRPAPSESFQQRQERWKVFGDRTRGVQNAFSTDDAADELSVGPRPVARGRTAEVGRAIPEKSRVRSLYSMPLEDVNDVPQRDSRDQAEYGRRLTRNTLQPPTRQQSTESGASYADGGPNVIRYGDFKTYITQGGDTLQTISRSFFGTPEYYFDLYLANRNVLGNPATVPVGVELKIPRMGK